MADHTQQFRRLLDHLLAERERLDADIQDVRRVIERHERGATTQPEPLIDVPREAGRAAPPGQARREILQLMADGDIWTPTKMGRARGTHPNAASNVMRRVSQEYDAPIRYLGNGRYVISSSPKGDGQASLPVAPGSDEHGVEDGREVGGP